MIWEVVSKFKDSMISKPRYRSQTSLPYLVFIWIHRYKSIRRFDSNYVSNCRRQAQNVKQLVSVLAFKEISARLSKTESMLSNLHSPYGLEISFSFLPLSCSLVWPHFTVWMFTLCLKFTVDFCKLDRYLLESLNERMCSVSLKFMWNLVLELGSKFYPNPFFFFFLNYILVIICLKFWKYLTFP